MKNLGLVTLLVAILVTADAASASAQQGTNFQRVTTTASSGSRSTIGS